MFGGGKSFTLFKVWGIRITVDWSWFIVLFLLIFWLSDFYRQLLGVPSGSTEPYLLAVASSFGFFASIVLHELGHAYMARREGIGITRISLWIFGGVAQMDRESDSPGAEFKVAVGGPLVTAFLTVLLIGLGIATVGWADMRNAMEMDQFIGSSGIVGMLGWLAAINLIVLVFNLLPAFPMDGGRIVRAIAWKVTGKRSAATRFAATLGRIFGYLFIVLGIVWAATGAVFSGVWLVLIGVLITGSARAATVQTNVTSRLEGIRVGDIMDENPVAVPGDTTIDRVLEEYFLRYQWSWFPVVDGGGRFLGMVIRDQIERVPETERAGTTVSEHLEMDSRAFHVSQEALLESLLGNPDMRRFGALMVTDHGGQLAGVITVEQLGRALRP